MQTLKYNEKVEKIKQNTEFQNMRYKIPKKTACVYFISLLFHLLFISFHIYPSYDFLQSK